MMDKVSDNSYCIMYWRCDCGYTISSEMMVSLSEGVKCPSCVNNTIKEFHPQHLYFKPISDSLNYMKKQYWTYDRFNDHVAFISLREILKAVDSGNYLMIDDQYDRLIEDIIKRYYKLDMDMEKYKNDPHKLLELIK